MGQKLGLAGRALRAASGWTAPQEAVGGLHLLKELVMKVNPLSKHGRTPLNLRLGPEGEIMYDSSLVDTPAAAMGSFVQTMPGAGDEDVLKHERRHVKQSDTLGPAYLPAAMYEALVPEYGSGALERDAIEHATPQSEMLRPGASMNKGAANPLFQALVRALAGSR